MNRRRRMHGRKRIKRTPFSKKKSITDTPKVSDLNPGANRTLVKAAEDAAMADVPHDYTGQFKTIEEGYSAGARSFGQSVGQGLQALGEGYGKKKAKEKSENTGQNGDSA